MLGGVAGVLVLVAGILVVLLIAGVAVLLHVRQRRRPPQEAPRTSWPRPAAQQETQQQEAQQQETQEQETRQQEAQQPSWWREADDPQPDAAGETTRLPLVRGPVDRSPIDSARAQRDPETVVTRRDPSDGSLFRPPDPPAR